MDYLYFLQNLREGSMSWLTPVLYCISEYGVTLAFLIPLVIYWCIDKKAGKKIVFAYSFSLVFNDFVKNIACVYRPWIKDERLHHYSKAGKTATGYSFPSGHTVGASSSYFGIGLWQKNRKAVAAIFFILPFFVAFARNWLGAHTLQDVCVGLAEGFLAAFFMSKVIEYFDDDKKDVILLCASLLVVAVFYVVVMLKSYPIDYLADGSIAADPAKMKLDFIKMSGMFSGFIIAWFLERRFVKFDVPESVPAKIIVGSIGVGTAGLFLYVLVPFIFSKAGAEVKGFARYFITMIWTVCLYPLVFSSILKKIKK
ncbi:phosphatase PAP2 family protein [Treponema sp.]|uniref:phosphatase PAP2 family protein n=1 Tax=Treponema sp. TaxID=166 RepID=UPI00298DB24D|nr:phosphatase PAP2 family protein [Treponema sp.]MCR5613773.1 phosphatase PAP2 family protein [Treponema sp.]